MEKRYKIVNQITKKYMQYLINIFLIALAFCMLKKKTIQFSIN